MREILVYDDYEIHKLGAGGGTQYEEVTTEKATRIDVTDVAKPKGKLIPFGRTTQNGEPNPDYPQPIENVEGRSCTNLFNDDLLRQVEGYNSYDENTKMWTTNAAAPSYSRSIFYNATGTISSRDVTKLIKASAGTYTFKFNDLINNTTSASTPINIATFDNNGNFLSRRDGSEVITVTLEQDGYIDIRRSPNEGTFSFSSIQMNEGSTALPYEKYFEGKRLEFNVCNKNLAKALRLGYYVGATGVYVADTTHTCSSEPVKIRNGASYKYSIDGVGVEGYAYEYDENDNYLGRKYFSASSVYTPTNGATYFNYAFKDSTLANVPLNSKVQIEEGTTATPYEEHKQQLIPFPLQKGQKLMEGDYLAEDGVHHVRGQVVLDGTENWILQNASAGQFLTRNPIGGNVILSDKFKVKSSYTSSGKPYLRGNLYAEIGTEFLNEISVEAWKGWLQNNPVLVEYERAQETIDPYTPAQAEAYSKLMNLMLYKGVNHIWTETDGLEPNLQLTYKRKKQSNVLQVSNVQPLNNLELNNTEETPEEITTEISEE